MDEITAAWIGVGGATVVGAVGWVLAGIANGRAKKANELAAEANRHAQSAVAEAVEANRVAVAANQLSEEANTVIKRQAAQSVEHWITQWRVEWDPEKSMLVFTNDGRDPAIDPSIVVNGEVLREAWIGAQPVARGERIRLEFPNVGDHRRRATDKLTQEWRQGLNAGVIGNFVSWTEQVPIIISWKSGLGKPHEERFQIEVS